jgi:glycosyltransferase involved in cell wall biosynthesis
MNHDSSGALPSVSVAMLAYNHGPYIERAIEGVLSQETDFPVELLIGEDHSTDNTLEIARHYECAHPGRVRVITSDQNVGGKKNLQRLESACTGKYIAYCEGDDYWHDPKKLQKQVAFLEVHPDYVLVHTEFRTVSIGTGHVVPNAARQPRDLDDGDAYNELLAGRRLVLTLTTCARTSVLRKVLAECPECYDPEYLMGDTQRWLELARRGRVKCLHEVTSTHLLLPESASQSNNPIRLLRFILSSKHILDHYIEKYGCPPAVEAAARARTSIGVLRCAFFAGDSAMAEQMGKEYRNSGGRRQLTAFLYRFGSKSPSRRRMVRPALRGADLWDRVLRKLNHL